jgi:hypothetical protein
VAGATLNNCRLVGNRLLGGNVYGGGAYACTLNNCVLSSNVADANIGRNLYGAGGGAANSSLNNCTLLRNSALSIGGGAYNCSLTNCTLVGNSASYGNGASQCSLTNCISYFNAGDNYNASTLGFCCTTPAAPGTGNITLDPLFVDPTTGDLHLRSNSPCINAGNNFYVTTSTDLDGNPRITNGTVDMGAYEFQGTSGSNGFHAWLAQYGLPTDGSADFTDSDGDGMNNWQEWRAATNPTNARSLLGMVSAARNGNDVRVTWQSEYGVSYFLQRSTNVAAFPAFTTIATNLPGQLGTTTYSDADVSGAPRLFYRVGVGN